MVLYLFCLHLYLNYSFSALHEKKDFRLTKICRKDRKVHFFVSFPMLSFTEILYFLKFSSNRNVRKEHLSVFKFLQYFWLNMKFSFPILRFQVNYLLTILKEKDDIFCRITAKTSHWSTFRRRCLFVIIKFLKTCFPKLWY